RVIAATNRDLHKAMERGTVLEDLYYRLNVFQIRLPPLRDRRADIVPLSEAFIGEIGRSIGRPPAGLSRDARTALMDYHWPGNVRELRNVLERAAILCDGGLIATEHLALSRGAGRARRRRRRARPEVGRARDDRESARRGALQQIARRQGARPDPRPALRAHAPARPRIGPSTFASRVTRPLDRTLVPDRQVVDFGAAGSRRAGA